MHPEPAESRYQRQTLRLAAGVLTAAVGAVIIAVALTGELDQYRFLRFPVGFYLAAQGLLIAITVLAFWFASMQRRIDARLEESEEEL